MCTVAIDTQIILGGRGWGGRTTNYFWSGGGAYRNQNILSLKAGGILGGVTMVVRYSNNILQILAENIKS